MNPYLGMVSGVWKTGRMQVGIVGRGVVCKYGIATLAFFTRQPVRQR